MRQIFYKLQATGNDFIFFVKEDLKITLSQEKIQKLCSRQTGVGADGLVVLEATPREAHTHQWTFFNSDGSSAEMCGNAARCATLLIAHLENKKEISMRTLAGVFKGEIAPDNEPQVQLQLPAEKMIQIAKPLQGAFNTGYLVNTGVPHCVIPTEKPWDLRGQSKELARGIYSQEFGPQGANLTFVNWLNKDILEVITLERGVNDFTLSCGTGVVAAAKVFAELYQHNGWKKIKTPGGTLAVNYALGSQQALLKGPAELVFKGEL